jgi:hypothetical protein
MSDDLITPPNMPFATALAMLEAALTQDPPDAKALVQAFDAIGKVWPDDPGPDEVRRLFAACHGALALGRIGTQPGRLSYAAMEMITQLVSDRDGSYRSHVRNSFNHHMAFGSELPKSRFGDGPIPMAHLPITAREARALIQPLFTQYEAGMADNPYAYLRLAWKVLEFPVAPFDRVFDAWLREVEAKGLGLGDSHSSLRRAMALTALAMDGRQRVSRKGVDTIFLPLLDHPNAMLAAAAARFIGMIHNVPEEFYTNGTPWALPDLLDHIAGRPAPVRRAVAGGFLNGFADCDEPFALLRKDDRMEGYDLDAWVFAVLNGTPEEVLIPSAQAFWFYVHEGFAYAPDFVMRLIDQGHDWEAMMCATEIRDVVEGMEPALQRLVNSDDREAAAGATRHLAAHYAARTP